MIFQRLSISAAKVRISEGNAKEKAIFLLHFRMKVPSTMSKVQLFSVLSYEKSWKVCIFAAEKETAKAEQYAGITDYDG